MKISYIKDLPAFLDHPIGEDIELHRPFSKPVSDGAKRFFFSLLKTQNLDNRDKLRHIKSFNLLIQNSHVPCQGEPGGRPFLRIL